MKLADVCNPQCRKMESGGWRNGKQLSGTEEETNEKLAISVLPTLQLSVDLGTGYCQGKQWWGGAEKGDFVWTSI